MKCGGLTCLGSGGQQTDGVVRRVPTASSMLPSDEPPQTSRVVTVEAGRSDERNNAASPVLANERTGRRREPAAPPPPEEELDDDEGPTNDGSPPGACWNAAMAAHNLNVTTTSFVRPDGSAKIATTYEPLERKDRPTDTKDQLTVATPASPPYFFQDVGPNICQVLGPWLAVAPTPRSTLRPVSRGTRTANMGCGTTI